MKITIDFDNETLITEQGELTIPGIKEKEKAVLDLLGIKEIDMQSLRDDINTLFAELGINAKA